MAEENYTIRFDMDPPLSDGEVLHLSEKLLLLHEKGVRNSSVKTDLYEYSFRHNGSRLNFLEGGIVHSYEGSIYSFEETSLVYDFGFKLIQKINAALN